MQMNDKIKSRTVTKMALGIFGVWSVTILGVSCNNQKAEAPKKAVTQPASATEDNLRKTVTPPKSDDAKDADAEEKTSTKSAKGKKEDSGSSKNSTTRTNNISGDFDAIISRLGLTRGEGEALQRVACSRDPEELARLASRFGFGGGSSGRNGFNLDRSGSSGFSRDDLDALRALAGSRRELSPDTIRRAQDALCNARSGSGGSNTKSSSSNRSSRDDDDDDDDN